MIASSVVSTNAEVSLPVAMIKSKVALVVLTFCYSLLLIYLYYQQVASYWAYLGFHWAPDLMRIILAGFVIFILTLFQPIDAKTRSVFLFMTLYLHSIPSFLYFAISGQSTSYFVTVLLGVSLLIAFSFFEFKRIVMPSLSWKHVFLLSFFFSACTLVALIVFLGASNFNFNLAEVYAFRSASKSQLPSVFGYLRPITVKVFLPIFLLLAFASRKPAYQALAIFFVLAFFAFSNHKSVVVSSLATVVLFYSLRHANSIMPIAKLLVILLVVCAFESIFLLWYLQIDIPGVLNSMVVRRSLFVPALLDQFHLAFFQEFPFTYWSQSKISFGLVDRVYDLNTPFLIGKNFFNRETMAANTGYIGSGYSNAGLLGVCLYASCLGIFISYLHAYGKQIGHSFVIGVAFTQIFGAITSSDLPTVMLTNGLGAIFFLFVFFPKKPLWQS